MKSIRRVRDIVLANTNAIFLLGFKPICKALGLNKRDKICYTIQSDGRVVISQVDQTKSDPILEQFLNFLARDLEKNPQHIQSISSNLVSRVQSLVAEVDLDLDARLSDEDE